MTRRPSSACFTVGLLVLIACGLTGCSTAPANPSAAEYNAAYSRGDYRQALDIAGAAAHAPAWTSNTYDRELASYTAGRAAEALGRTRLAEQYLLRAADSGNDRLAGEAISSLGLMHLKQGEYTAAARELLHAATKLTGENRARAYFFAATAQQKLDRWPQARTNLLLARSLSRDANFRQQVEAQLHVTGYTIQLGAFRKRDNARDLAQQVASRAVQLHLGPPRLITQASTPGTSSGGTSGGGASGGLTLVQVGRFVSYAVAQQARQDLARDSAIIVPLGG